MMGPAFTSVSTFIGNLLCRACFEFDDAVARRPAHDGRRLRHQGGPLFSTMGPAFTFVSTFIVHLRGGEGRRMP